MLNKKMFSQLVTELSTEEQELLSGGYGYYGHAHNYPYRYRHHRHHYPYYLGYLN